MDLGITELHIMHHEPCCLLTVIIVTNTVLRDTVSTATVVLYTVYHKKGTAYICS